MGQGAATFDLVTAWPAINADDAAAVREFWRAEGAILDAQVAAERVRQVVAFARTAQGQVAGVCTAIPVLHPRFGQPMYYWRTFVGAAWRRTPLVMSLLKRSCQVLADHAAANEYPCIGILLELENERFAERGRKAVWFNPRFVYAGLSERGLEVRVHYFPGVRLKTRVESVPATPGAAPAGPVLR